MLVNITPIPSLKRLPGMGVRSSRAFIHKGRFLSGTFKVAGPPCQGVTKQWAPPLGGEEAVNALEGPRAARFASHSSKAPLLPVVASPHTVHLPSPPYSSSSSSSSSSCTTLDFPITLHPQTLHLPIIVMPWMCNSDNGGALLSFRP